MRAGVDAKTVMEFIVMGKKQRLKAGLWPDFAVVPGSSRSQPTRLPRWQQSSPEQIRVRQRKGGKQAGRILCQAAITHLGVAPWSFDHMEGVLAPHPGLGTQPVDGLLMFSKRLGRRGAAVDSVTDPSLLGTLAVKFAPVGLVAEDFLLLAMQQLGQLVDVGRVGGRG